MTTWSTVKCDGSAARAEQAEIVGVEGKKLRKFEKGELFMDMERSYTSANALLIEQSATIKEGATNKEGATIEEARCK